MVSGKIGFMGVGLRGRADAGMAGGRADSGMAGVSTTQKSPCLPLLITVEGCLS